LRDDFFVSVFGWGFLALVLGLAALDFPSGSASSVCFLEEPRRNHAAVPEEDQSVEVAEKRQLKD
jgi:hypothetical protein